MAEPDTSDALNAEIDAAKLAGDMGLANELYRRQQGTTDAFGLAPLPAVPDAEGVAAPETGTGEHRVFTGADDETVAVTRAIPCKMAVAAGCALLSSVPLAVEPVAQPDQEGPCAGQEARHQERQRRPAPAGLFLGAAGQTICYHVHGGSYCHLGGVHELPSKQMDYVGRSGGHRPGCDRRGLRLAGRLAGRRDATSAVKHYSVLPGRLHPA